MDTLVDYDLAKILKDAGFDVPCREGWVNYLTPFTGKTGMPDNESDLVLDTLGNTHLIERSTIAKVIMWLYEKHKIWISVRPFLNEDGDWEFRSYAKLMRNYKRKEFQLQASDPIKAYIKAIEYVLNIQLT